MKKFRILALVLAAVLCLSLLAACGGNGDTPTSSGAPAPTSEGGEPSEPADSGESGSGNLVPATGTSDETLNAALPGEPDSLFPNFQGSKVSGIVDSAMFDTLVYWNDETKTAEPRLATEWEWLNEDFTRILFTLRDDVVFSNGEKLTANDVLVSLQATTEYTRATYAQMFDIANSKVVDDTHLELALKQSYGNLPDILGCTYYAIFSAKGFEDTGKDTAAFAREPVTSGPYKLAEWKQGESLTLTRNEDYWDKENLPYYKNIVFSFIDDASSRALALQSGDVQVAFHVNNSQIAELESYEGIAVNPYVQNVAQPLTINESFPSLADENVRKAIMLCLDKEALNQVGSLGYSEVSRSSLAGTVSPYYFESETFTQDVEAAKKLIDDSDWTAEDLTYTMYTVTGRSTDQHEILQAQLAAIGITLKLESVDLPTMLSYVWAGEVPLHLGENDNWDISRMLKAVDSRVETSHEAYRGDDAAELHALIDAAYAASDEDRYDAYAAVQKFCSDHYVITSVANVVLADAYADNLVGLEHDSHSWPTIYNMRPLVEG